MTSSPSLALVLNAHLPFVRKPQYAQFYEERWFTPGALATQDVDLLWDARRRVRFLADMARLDSSLLDVLRRADRSFERKEDQLETAINARGFEVDFLRRQPQDDDPHPFRFSDDEGDLWPVQARRAAGLQQG